MSTPQKPRRFFIYLPTDPPLGLKMCEAVEFILCDRFGGVTSYPARGIFRMGDGKRVAENIQVLEAYCEADMWAMEKTFLWALAGVVGKVLEQEAVACALEGRMELVPPNNQIAGPSLTGKPVSECEAIIVALITKALD